MLPPDGESDRFLITKETKLLPLINTKFNFSYVFRP